MRFRSVRNVFLLACLICCVCVVPVYAVSDDTPAVQVVSAPKYAPYIGSGWITGTADGIGDVYDSSGYQYSDLHLTVTSANLDVATTFPGGYTFANSWPYIVIGLLGVILVCLMRYKR